MECLLRYLINGRLEFAVVFFQDGLHLPEDHLILILAKWHDTSFVDREFAIRYHLREVYLVNDAQTFAMRTSALGRVEREVVGCRITVADACCGTHQSLGEMLDRTCVFVENQNQSLALFHGDANGFAQSFFIFFADLQFVDDDLNVMIFVSVHLHASHNLLHLSVNADVQIPFTTHGFKEFTIVTLTASDERCQDKDLLAGIVVENHFNHFLLRVLHHLFACGIAIGLASTGKKQTHIVVDLCCSANSGTWILVGRLLFDTDDRR